MSLCSPEGLVCCEQCPVSVPSSDKGYGAATDALDANARILRFKSYLVSAAIALLLLGVPLILAHNL